MVDQYLSVEPAGVVAQCQIIILPKDIDPHFEPLLATSYCYLCVFVCVCVCY